MLELITACLVLDTESCTEEAARIAVRTLSELGVSNCVCVCVCVCVSFLPSFLSSFLQESLDPGIALQMEGGPKMRECVWFLIRTARFY